MSRWLRPLFVALALTTLPAPLLAQSGRALVLYVHGGRWVAGRDLAETGDAFDAAFAVGGGVGLQLSSNAALRGDFSVVNTDYGGTTITLADSSVTRFYGGADLQVGWPTESGFTPYIFFGGGAVATDPEDPTQGSSTDFGGRFGTGFNLVTGRRAFFGELLGWVYNFDGLGFDRTQVDWTIRVGFAVAIPF